MTGEVQSTDSDVAVAVVGVIVPDEPRFHGPAFNRAAQMFQGELVRALVRAGIDVNAVFSIEPLAAYPRGTRLRGRRGRVTTEHGLAVRFLPYVNIVPLKALTVGLAAFVALAGWAWRNRRRPRIIHVFNLTMPPGLFVWLAGRLTGSRVTVSVLDVWKPGELVPDVLRWRMDFWMQRVLLPKFDGHAVVSPAIREDLIPGRRVCVIEGGIAPARFATAGELPDALATRAPGRFRVILSGSLEPYNGVELTLAAMALLPDDVELIVAGGGSQADLVREAARRNRRVTFAGFLSFEDVLSLYGTADLLLNMRITQAIDTRYFFPSKLMELLASGVPVLSTCTGQVEAHYGHALYLLHDETPGALAARVLELRGVDPIERAALGAHARAFVFREKTWERQGRKLAHYFRKEVLKGTTGWHE